MLPDVRREAQSVVVGNPEVRDAVCGEPRPKARGHAAVIRDSRIETIRPECLNTTRSRHAHAIRCLSWGALRAPRASTSVAMGGHNTYTGALSTLAIAIC